MQLTMKMILAIMAPLTFRKRDLQRLSASANFFVSFSRSKNISLSEVVHLWERSDSLFAI